MIRKAKLSDILSLMPLAKEYHFASKARREILFEHAIEHWAKGLTFCITDPAAVCLIAESPAGPVGFLTATAATSFWNPTATTALHHMLWVTPAFRGQDVERNLLESFIIWAKEQKCNTISARANCKIGAKELGKLLAEMGFEIEEKVYIMRSK